MSGNKPHSGAGSVAPTRLFAFGHPNHELAVFGLIQEHRPHLLYLTDGGGPQRVGETKRGLEQIGLAEKARFLGYPEKDFYAALLQRDHDYFAAIAKQVRDQVDEIEATEVSCESVEFYNPMHDVTLPTVRRAVADLGDVAVKEFPLIYQTNAGAEQYRVQRFPAGWSGSTSEHRLSAAQLDTKISAKDHIYRALHGQLGPLLDRLPLEAIATEHVGMAEAAIRAPAADQCLRYERRGALLRDRGEVAEVITFEDNFLPVVQALGVT